MMTYENYRKMKEFSVALAESFHSAEIKVEIMEILSENSPMTAKEIAEKFMKKFHVTSDMKEEFNHYYVTLDMEPEEFNYYYISKNSIAQHIQKLITMGKVRIAEEKLYPVNVTPYSEIPTYITGCTCVYTVA